MQERLRKTQTDVFSVIKNGFECTPLKNEELIQVFLHKNQVNAGKAKVRYDNAYFRTIVRLSRVPSRTIPLLPCNTAPVNIPLGISFINPQKTVGLGELSDLIVFCGSDQKLLIGALQHFVKTILAPKRKIIIFDFNNELGGLAQGIPSIGKNEPPLTILQLGKNFSFNLFDIEIPSLVSEYSSQIAYQMNTVVHMLAYASETDEMVSNLAQLRYAMMEATKELSLEESREELSLQNITKSDVFTNIFRTTDHLTIDRLGTELKLFSTSPELNDGEKDSTVVKNLGRNPGITLIQFPTQIFALKRLVFAFLLQKLAFHCDMQTVVIATHASKLLGKEYIHPHRRIFEDAINNYYTKIRQSGCLVLSTHSVSALHSEVQKDISTGIFFTLLDVEDRDWLTVKYALEAKLGVDVPNVSAFLKSLQQEGLLFREDVNTTFDHFVPFTLDPVEPGAIIKDITPSSSSLDDLVLNEKQFTWLMTMLGQLQMQEVTEQAMIQYFRDIGFTNIKDDWENLCKLPYFHRTQNGNDRILSLSSEGRVYYTHIDNLIHQLPPPISLDSHAIDSTLNKLRSCVEKSSQNNTIEQHQLKTLIGEVAGAFLNEYLQMQGVVDWPLVKKYVDLLEIVEVHPNNHPLQLELLEMLYTEIDAKIKIKSSA